MSGLADLASWALRGGANNNNNNNDDDDNNNNNNRRNDSAEAPLTAEEMRAQRLARMEEQQKKKRQEEDANNNNGGGSNDKDDDDPMDIDPSPPSSSATAQQAAAAATASALATSSSALSSLSTSPMVVDSKKGARSSSLKPAPAVKQSAPASCTPNHKESKKKKSSHNNSASSPSDGGAAATTTRATNKTQRKKELLLKKILHVRLEGSSIPSDAGSSTSTTVELDLDDGGGSGSAAAADISVSSMAMIVATRLSVEPPAPTSPHRLSHHLSSAAASAMGSMANDHHSLHYQKKYPPLIAYLAGCHVRACEEIRSMKQSSGGGSGGGLGGSGSNHKKQASQNAETAELVNEIRKLVVNYAASCIAEPGLFPGSDDAANQLARCLLNGLTDVSNSITFGLGGGGASTSFYYCLCEELLIQDSTGRLLESTVRSVVAYYTKQLGRPGGDSVLEGGGDFGVGGSGSNTCSPTMLVTALQAVCVHKRAALAVTGLDCFLLPPEGTTEASQTVRNTPPAAMAGGGMTAANVQLLQMLAGEVRSYKKRSGPALEKDTLLGLALRVGAPKNNPAFVPTSILRQSVDSVERSSLSQRQLLRSHQESCHALIMSLIKAGPVARERVLRWFQDALAVNVGADAYRPDQTKVSGTNLLLNTTTVLLKLCQPFVDDASKRHLIDPGFVRSEKDHGGVYATAGDDAVARLGGDDEDESAAPYEYAPKNAFIPKCFFFCARSLHFGIVPALAYHEILLRHINHAHWEISNRNGDVHSDPNFAHLICRQRSAEVPLFQDEMVHDTLRFCNLMAVCLLEMPDEHLKHMAEHFVSDVCSVVQGVAKMKPRLLRNVHVENVFCIVVKLLSAKYATMVRNYNLRATLGDVLYELYLPPTAGDRREVPPSVCCDAAGRTLLLSNGAAQETLAPSLLLLYGEVEHTGYYDKMSHRAKIASLLKYLWESNEHRPAFRRITQNEKSFVKFANGIMNETNTLIATVMQKLPEIRASQEQMKNVAEWGLLSEDQQGQITARLEDNEREVKHALPLCNKTLQMFGYLNTDPDIRSLFCLEELCPRLVTMLLHVLTKLVGSKGLDLKVDNPEQYDFRPKEMLRDLCAIFALFSSSREFQVECAKSGCDPALLRSAVKTCQRLVLLTGESMTAFEALPGAVRDAAMNVKADEALIADAPDEFLDEILSTYMKDPVILPSGHTVDRSTITQHLLNDETDPFNREPMTVADIKPASELKVRMNAWLLAKQRKQQQDNSQGGKEEEMEMDAGAETHS